MIKSSLVVVTLCLLGLGGNAFAAAARQRLPEISGYTLDSEPLSLPADLDAPATLIVIVEEDPFAEDVGSWRSVASQIESEVPALFLVMMGDKRGLSRSMAAGRLRGDVRDADFRANLVPVFQDGEVLRGSLDIASSSRVSAVLVNQSGEVIWRARGPASEAAASEIWSSLKAPLQPVPIVSEPPAKIIADAGTFGPEVVTDVVPEATPKVGPEVAIPVATTPPASASNAIEPAKTPPKMPELKGVTLSGETLPMPGDLTKNGARLILVPDHAGHDGLVAALSEAELAETEDASDWYVLLFMGKSPRFGKAVAAGQLRAKLESSHWRARVVPVYMELSTFELSAGLEPGVGTRIVRATQDGALSAVID